jgi:hypothetical protein
MHEVTAQRLRVAYGQCSECNTVAEYYYDLNATVYEIEFIESCTLCKAKPSHLSAVTVTKGAN